MGSSNAPQPNHPAEEYSRTRTRRDFDAGGRFAAGGFSQGGATRSEITVDTGLSRTAKKKTKPMRCEMASIDKALNISENFQNSRGPRGVSTTKTVWTDRSQSADICRGDIG
jgi:hypothetical protein